MKLRRKCGTFVALRWSDRALIGEAVLWLGLARLLVLALPFRLLARKLVAHTWLLVGGTVVVGAAGIPGVTRLASFG